MKQRPRQAGRGGGSALPIALARVARVKPAGALEREGPYPPDDVRARSVGRRSPRRPRLRSSGCAGGADDEGERKEKRGKNRGRSRWSVRSVPLFARRPDAPYRQSGQPHRLPLAADQKAVRRQRHQRRNLRRWGSKSSAAFSS